jgi:NADPH:quinone reductase-like Zn-dependent oxidoreductase
LVKALLSTGGHLGAEVATTGSAANADLLRSLGADRVVDYRTEDFADVLTDYDVVLDPMGPDSVLKSASILRPGGIVVGIGGPPDTDFATQLGKPVLKPLFTFAARKARAAARKRGGRYTFLFMWADGEQLSAITDLIDRGAIRPVVDRTFTFDEIPDALAYVDTGRAKGKVVIVVDPAADPTSRAA